MLNFLPPSRPAPTPSRALRFDRHELAGALGDLGTDLPLLIGVIGASGLDAASVLILFGLMQLFSGFWYRLPMPVQPLKAFAALVIAQHVPARVIYGGGLAVGLGMLALTVTGLIDGLARLVPKAVVRGIQLGLALQLSTLALKTYVPADCVAGYALAAVAFGLTLVLAGAAAHGQPRPGPALSWHEYDPPKTCRPPGCRRFLRPVPRPLRCRYRQTLWCVGRRTAC